MAVQSTPKAYQEKPLVNSFKFLCRYTDGRRQLLPMTSLASLASVVMPCAGPLLLVLNSSKLGFRKLEARRNEFLQKHSGQNELSQTESRQNDTGDATASKIEAQKFGRLHTHTTPLKGRYLTKVIT